MPSEMERQLITGVCLHLFKEPNLAEILAETTCKQIENGMVSFKDWANNALTKKTLSDNLRQRLSEAITGL
jgi:hypothetical protein